MKRIFLFLTAALLVASTAFAGKTYVVSVTQIVEHPALDAMRNGVADRLKEKGIDFTYNVHIAQGNMATNTQIVSQIMGEQPDLVLAIATPGAQACAQKIKETPIVFTGVTDPVSAGLVKDIQNSGGTNITGMSDFSPMDKHVALIREIVPAAKTIGIIYNSGEPNSVPNLKALKDEAAKVGMSVEEATIANSSGVYQAAKSLVGRCDVVYIGTDNTVVSAIESAVKVCTDNKLPLVVGDVDSVARGAIAAVAVDYYKMGLQTGDMVARILQGANPGSMPVEFLNDLNLHVNLKAAQAMGVTLPESLVARATKVIE
ncbi:ABC transporter substrate-binding protein [Pseudodesulfovibrio indicus]|jgi:putative ABC transport system substrate-binding protein|uniref:ABC transport system substrate-binding protein n=1 Tax=Pseudodesulfovibrio indicus TaxID=1716143 RepID=A0A126QPU8_9BACT|nr:ABC transporter substrate-binding protein [Pseudodesulfovibrio indicus]AMK11756.1 ABC transporter permease [Pseudodesulfovibrio indicus]TDT88294.1 putative ABC transport system substrate-binding protein [Pseudodesulfovibrio indicus]